MKSTKLVCMVLAVIMLVSLVPAGAMAEGGSYITYHSNNGDDGVVVMQSETVQSPRS